MLGQAGETEFDVRLNIFGFYVRIHPLFWVGAAFIIWNSTSDPRLKFLGVFCVLISILVHELGHAIFIRKWGYQSDIVLTALGGYATSGHFSTWRQVWVSFAGPLAGFFLLGVVIAASLGIEMVRPGTMNPMSDRFIPAVLYALNLLYLINLWWSVINLAPALPMDGGHILQALMMRYAPRKGVEWTLQISILTCGALAYWGFTMNARFMMILFGIMCAQNVIAYNEYQGRR